MQPGVPEIAPPPTEQPFCVTDLKQWVYCPRILYFRLCLPAIRPLTYKMEAGIEDGEAEAQRESRRSLRTYGLKSGRREYDVALASGRLGLRGKIDMLILREEPGEEELIPVDYKLSDLASPHFRLQLMAVSLHPIR